MHVMPGVTVTIAGLTISSGDGGQQGGGGILNDHAVLTMDRCAVQNSFVADYSSGGGVYNDGSEGSATLTIHNSTVTGNHAYYAGGGIYNDAYNGGSATLSLMNSTVDGNVAAYDGFPAGGGEGGGIYNGGGELMITNSVVSNNPAGVSDPFPVGYGGGISNGGTLTITNSTINGNGCYLAGGGIDNYGTLIISSSTVSGNGATGQHDGQPWGEGGGISGTVTFINSTLSGNYASLSAGGIEGGGVITNSTISGNTASQNGGGISVYGALEIGNTILKAGPFGANIFNNGGTVTSHGYNPSSDDGGGYLTGPGDQINTDPLLGPLQNNGGPTLSPALLPGSPAINTGDPNFTPPPSYDQRDSPFVRVYNGRIDIDSFEAQPPRRATPAPRSRPTPPPRPTPR
jgi:parallel beta-helix repeat protein